MGATNEQSYAPTLSEDSTLEYAKCLDSRDKSVIQLGQSVVELRRDYEEQMLANCVLQRRIVELESALSAVDTPVSEKITGVLDGDAEVVSAALRDFTKLLYLFDRQYKQLTAGEEDAFFPLDMVSACSSAAHYVMRSLHLDGSCKPNSVVDKISLKLDVDEISRIVRERGGEMLAEVVLFALLTSRAYNIDLALGFRKLLEDIEYDYPVDDGDDDAPEDTVAADSEEATAPATEG